MSKLRTLTPALSHEGGDILYLIETTVEDAAVEWFHHRRGYGGHGGELGHAAGHGPDMAPGQPADYVRNLIAELR